MERILVLLNANRPDVGCIDFACQVAAMTSSKLTGLLVDGILQQHSTHKAATYWEDDEPVQHDCFVTTDAGQAARIFTDECARKGIDSEVQADPGDPLQQTLKESRFADLIVLSPGLNCTEPGEEWPTHFVRSVLRQAACPLLLAPRTESPVNEVVFCYDGSPSSIFALKQFTYLFPQLQEKKAVLLEVTNKGTASLDEDHRHALQWLEAHYPSATYRTLAGEAREELFGYFFLKHGMLIVMGAFGRSYLSGFFRRSSAEDVIRTVDLPLFITHH